MQKLILALFSVVALLGLVAPSFAHGERNSNRLARGHHPLPPSRRGSAKRSSPSQRPYGHGINSARHIQLRDAAGTALGFLTDFTGNGGDLLVTYYPGSHLLSFHGQRVSDAHFLGASGSNSDLDHSFVYLGNVAVNDHQAHAHIWTLNGDGQLIPIWPNSHGGATPVDLFLNSAEGAIALTGDPSSLSSGWKKVEFYLVN